MKNGNTLNMDALYAEWSRDCTAETPTPLKTWLLRYPEHKDALSQWTADVPVLEAADRLPADSAADARTLAIGMQVVAEMRAKYNVAPAPLKGIVETARPLGINPRTLCQRLEIDASLLGKLQNRLLRFATIPQELISRLAKNLEVSAEQVRAYLQQPPTLSRSAMYNAAAAPQVAEPQDFAQAVRDAADLSAEQKAFWLSTE